MGNLGYQKLLKRIQVRSENDPNNPEFPPDDPKFPATPTYPLAVPGFSNVRIKDESHNPTGTHKDRMAWEIVVTYRDMIAANERLGRAPELPSMSLISSGSAAIAIQTMLQHYDLPPLKVLMDVANTPDDTISFLRKMGAEVFFTDLSKKELNSTEILVLTKNKTGIDITSAEALGPSTRYYDWLSYEIINESPEYCFIPFGTGNLYENILNTVKKECSSEQHDPRFFGNIHTVSQCVFLGATTNNPNSKATKLYSPHLPFVHFDEQWIHTFKLLGYCHQDSEVDIVEEQFIDQALDIARSQHISCEPSGIAGLALLLQKQDQIPRNARILIVNTGRMKELMNG